MNCKSSNINMNFDCNLDILCRNAELANACNREIRNLWKLFQAAMEMYH